MNRLSQQYGEQIEFINLNVDDSSTAAMRDEYGLTGRSQYALIDAQGTVIERWFGPLNGDSVAAALETYLAEG